MKISRLTRLIAVFLVASLTFSTSVFAEQSPPEEPVVPKLGGIDFGDGGSILPGSNPFFGSLAHLEAQGFWAFNTVASKFLLGESAIFKGAVIGPNIFGLSGMSVFLDVVVAQNGFSTSELHAQTATINNWLNVGGISSPNPELLNPIVINSPLIGNAPVDDPSSAMIKVEHKLNVDELIVGDITGSSAYFENGVFAGNFGYVYYKESGWSYPPAGGIGAVAASCETGDIALACWYTTGLSKTENFAVISTIHNSPTQVNNGTCDLEYVATGAGSGAVNLSVSCLDPNGDSAPTPFPWTVLWDFDFPIIIDLLEEDPEYESNTTGGSGDYTPDFNQAGDRFDQDIYNQFDSKEKEMSNYEEFFQFNEFVDPLWDPIKE